METEMLKVVVTILNVVLILLKTFLRPRPKTAKETLPEESPTAEAIAEGEKKAEEKFGPRP